jgi:hypothetical protein
MAATNSCVELMKGTLVLPVPRYPASVVTDAALKIAANQVETTLIGRVSSADWLFRVSDTSRLVVDMLLTIDSEIVSVATIDTTSNIITVTRGFDGTIPSSHNAGSALRAFIDAWHHNALAAEVKAIEAALGPNLSNIPGSSSGAASIISTAYNFPAQSPGGNLIVGNNVITLAPVPRGINGTNTNHYLYVSGGTGTAEAVLITGGTAVSGAPSGTLIINCASAHSGAWTIRSATAGVQEAVSTLIPSGGGMVVVPAGTHNFYGPFTAPPVPTLLVGAGAGTLITVNQKTGFVFAFEGGAVDSGITQLQMRTADGTPQNVIAIKVGGNGSFLAQRLTMAGFAEYFHINGPSQLNYIDGNVMLDPFSPAKAIYFPGVVPTGNTVISNNTIACGVIGEFQMAIGTDGNAGVSGIWIMNNNIFQCDFGIYAAGTCGQIFSLHNAYQSCGQIGVAFIPAAVDRFQRAIVCIGDNFETGQGVGIQIGGGPGGSVDSVALVNCNVNLGAKAGIILAPGAVNTTVNNCIAADNSQIIPGGYPGLRVLAGTSKWQVVGGVYGPAEGSPTTVNSQSYGIEVQAGASDYYSITGAFIPMNTTGTLFDGGTGVHKVIANNLGVDTQAFLTVASATTVALPANDSNILYVSGTTSIATITGGWIGRRITFIKSDGGTLIVGAGGNVLSSRSIIQGNTLTLVFDGANWWA